MPQEIERKYLVKHDGWRSHATGTLYRQGYLAREPNRTVRVRVAGDRGFLTIKGATQGISRVEYEYPIPLTDAQEMLDTLCDEPPLEKVRYLLTVGNLTWEIDEFRGANQGLILAEVELHDENQAIALPDWVGAEVSHDPRYYNANLIKVPYSQWTESLDSGDSFTV